jgi:subtilisin-like proprotein convertase family protein
MSNLFPSFSSRHFKFLLPLAFLAVNSVTEASITWSGPTINVSTTVPDNDDVGLTSTQTVSGNSITQIESITVTINLTGGWNGDLYAHLVHDSGFSVLLNRPGRSLADPDGAGSSGMVINFEDAALSDIHTAIPMSGGSFSGTFQPDGRTTDPYDVLDSDSRPAMLSSFTGLNANGNWTLFIADQSAGETSTLQSWSVTITGVPEPSTLLLSSLAIPMLLRRRRPSTSGS